jgi:hypothetical protein
VTWYLVSLYIEEDSSTSASTPGDHSSKFI